MVGERMTVTFKPGRSVEEKVASERTVAMSEQSLTTDE